MTQIIKLLPTEAAQLIIHPDIEIVENYNLNNLPLTTEYYLIYDLANWDAVVVFDPVLDIIVSCSSDLLSIDEVTEYVHAYRKGLYTVTI